MYFHRPAFFCAALLATFCSCIAEPVKPRNKVEWRDQRVGWLDKSMGGLKEHHFPEVSSHRTSLSTRGGSTKAITSLSSSRKVLLGLGVYHVAYLLGLTTTLLPGLQTTVLSDYLGDAVQFYVPPNLSDSSVIFSAMVAFMGLRSVFCGTDDTVKLLLEGEALLWAGSLIALLKSSESASNMLAKVALLAGAALSMHFSRKA